MNEKLIARVAGISCEVLSFSQKLLVWRYSYRTRKSSSVMSAVRKEGRNKKQNLRQETVLLSPIPKQGHLMRSDCDSDRTSQSRGFAKYLQALKSPHEPWIGYYSKTMI